MQQALFSLRICGGSLLTFNLIGAEFFECLLSQ
jgi:hypothetical protein